MIQMAWILENFPDIPSPPQETQLGPIFAGPESMVPMARILENFPDISSLPQETQAVPAPSEPSGSGLTNPAPLFLTPPFPSVEMELEAPKSSNRITRHALSLGARVHLPSRHMVSSL